MMEFLTGGVIINAENANTAGRNVTPNRAVFPYTNLCANH